MVSSIEIEGEDPVYLQPADADTRADYLILREAICLIAFGSLEFPPVGVLSWVEMMMIDAVAEEESSHEQGRYDLAREQLLTAAGSGLIPLYGRVENIRHKSFGDPNESPQRIQVRVEAISTEALKLGNYYEEDGKYCIGDVWYDLVIVDLFKLKSVFKAFLYEGGELPAESRMPIDAGESQSPRKSLGRPPKWNWDEILLEVTLLADTIDGLPETQAEMERWIARHCLENYGSEPSPSSIRSKVAPLYERKRNRRTSSRLAS